ncbi:metallophosphoesterase family protein [Paenibacillus sp. GCM10027629]|uniref:metallophosphoesterase family protein n=1 Tax=Paenibacillus sp. GCM10027629 TaxID=3273414 RepID=UPI003628CFBD
MKPNIHFQVISDTHVAEDPNDIYSINFDRALKDIRKTAPDSDGIMHVGDVTDRGLPGQFKTMAEIWDRNKEGLPPMYFTTGNHDVRWADFEERMASFREATGIEQLYYDFWIKGYHFIFLGTEKPLKDCAYLSEEQLAWFEQKIAENAVTDKPIFIFVHEPMMNTVAGAQTRFGWHGIRQDRELKTILSKYPQSILFTGHTHWELGAKDTMYHAKYATLFNVPSTAYLWTDEDEHKDGSQGYYVEVYDDRVLLRGRDFANGAWVSEAEYSISLPPQIPMIDPETDPDLTLSNPTMQLDKRSYLVGEAIRVSYTGSLNKDAFGIFPRGAVPNEVRQIEPIASILTNTIQQPDGVLTFEHIELPPGEYDMIYLGETMNVELTRWPFEVAAE